MTQNADKCNTFRITFRIGNVKGIYVNENNNLTATLQLLLKQAKEGRITALAYATTGDVLQTGVVAADDDAHRSLYAAVCAQQAAMLVDVMAEFKRVRLV